MRLYASNSKISRSARRRAQLDRPAGVVDLNSAGSRRSRRPVENVEETGWQRLRRTVLAPSVS